MSADLEIDPRLYAIADAIMREWCPGGRIDALSRSYEQDPSIWQSKIRLDANMRYLIAEIALEALE